MAVTTDDLIIAIQADSKKAVKGIEAITKELGDLSGELKGSAKSMKDVEKATNDWGAALVKLNQAVDLVSRAYNAFAGSVSSTVDAFIVQDDAVNRLRNTLQLIGTKDVEAASQRFQKFASTLQENSTIGDEVTLQYLSMAKAMRLSDEQAEMLIQTSADLAAVQGKDLDSSFQALVASLKGEAGELSKLAPELRNLSAEHLRNGAAVEFLSKKFAGFAKAQTKTIGGSLKQVSNLYGDVVEDIGRLINDFFRFDDTQFAIEALTMVQEAIADIRPAVIEARETIVQFVSFFNAGFEELSQNAEELEAVFIALGVAVAAAFGPTIIAALTSFGTALAASAASAALLAAKLLAVVAVVTSVVAAVEIVIKNFSKLDKIGIIVVNAMIVGFRKVKDFLVDLAKSAFEAFKNLAKGIGDLFSISNLKKLLTGGASASDIVLGKIKEGFNTLNTQLGKDNQELIAEIKGNAEELDFGVTGKAINGLKKFMKGFNDEVEVAKKKQAELGNAAVQAAEKAKKAQSVAPPPPPPPPPGPSKEQIKILADIMKANGDIELQIKQTDMTQREAIDAQIQRQLELIDLKREELKLQGNLSTEIDEALKKQASLTKEAGTKAKEAAPPQALESLTKSGEAIGASITEAFAPLLGFTGGVDAAVGAAQAVVDAIPNMLNNITNLIVSITELPIKILESFDKLLQSVLDLIAKLPANLIKAVGGIIKSAVNFVKELPKVISETVKELPKLLMDLVNELPAMIEELVTALVAAGPDIATSLITFLIKDAPKISIKLAKVLAIELPIAIVNGIVAGLQQVAETVKGFFTGGFNLVDTDQIEKDLKDTFKKVQGAASRLFAVTDLADQAQAADRAKDITKDVEEAGKKAADFLKKAWLWVLKQLEKLWKWIKEKVIDPLLKGLMKAWKWVVEKIIKPLAEAVEKAWRWVLENILEPLGEAVSKAWKWVLDNILEPLGELVMKAWQWVLENVVDPLIDGLKAAWEIMKTQFQVVANIMKTVWKGMIDILKSVWDGLVNVLKSAWESVTNILKNTFEGLKEVWNIMMDIFQGKIDVFEGIGQIFATVFETAKENFMEVFGFFQDVVDAIANVFKTYTDALKNIFNSVIEGAGTIGEKIWEKLKGALGGAGEIFENLGKGIWNGLKGGLDTLSTFFKDMFDKLNPGNLFEKIFKVDFKGKGTVENALNIDVPFVNFAQGGMVPGNASIPGDSELNDKIVALLSPGEAVISRSKMNNPAIAALVDAIIKGDIQPPKFGIGGVVGKIAKGDFKGAAKDVQNAKPQQAIQDISNAGKAAVSAVESLDPRNLWDEVREKVFEGVMKMFEANKFNQGGLVGDTVPSMLTPGEFVVSRRGVQSQGLANLQAINQGKQMPQVINYEFNLPMTIENKGQPVDSAFVKQKIMPTVQTELKRLSLEGRFVISGKGIRDA